MFAQLVSRSLAESVFVSRAGCYVGVCFAVFSCVCSMVLFYFVYKIYVQYLHFTTILYSLFVE